MAETSNLRKTQVNSNSTVGDEGESESESSSALANLPPSSRKGRPVSRARKAKA